MDSDCITTDTNGEDYSWDAVWKSKAIITDFGWAIEMNSICSLALLRKKTNLGLNFFREIRRDRFKYSWNFIDSKIGTFTQQNGQLEGIENIKHQLDFFTTLLLFYVNGNSQQKQRNSKRWFRCIWNQ
jgi:hypothetical protein